jgi:hypothetical protein
MCQREDTTDKDTLDHNDQFHRDGYVCIRKAVDVSLLQPWQTFAPTYFAKAFVDLNKHGHSTIPVHAMNGEYALGIGIRHGFREIVMRSPGRYELSLLHTSNDVNNANVSENNEVKDTRLTMPPIQPLQMALTDIMLPLFQASSWEDLSLCQLSLVVSTPGATAQAWHADGGHVDLHTHQPCHVLNVFVPLQTVSMDMGPTAFRPGTHVHTRDLARLMLVAHCQKTLRPLVAPTLELGDVLVFDYRVLHRGLANRQSVQHRIYLVLTVSRPWFKDIINFPSRSLYSPVTTTIPLSDTSGCAVIDDNNSDEKE